MDSSTTRPIRKRLGHTPHFAGRFGGDYFITICCQQRKQNQLCREEVAALIFETAKRYQASERWHLHILLLMPDHLHMLIGIDGDTELSNLIRDFKRATARFAGIKWQRNFFDHRLRHDEGLSEKYDYIIANPVRAGLIRDGEGWPFQLIGADLPLSQPPGD